MKKTMLVITLAIAGVVAWATVPRDAPSKPWKTTDVWYHTSDPATLATTGRPQLVEFFHPD